MKISLRAYNLEITELIDQGQYEEAIVHSKHILTKFPKCIETYRNIGNSLLELKRYSEAKDIFTRVLAVFPDDFVSHVGLSIISEAQKNIDLAIWHMELAFDVQPSNLAVQDELKRLFKIRDGEIPSKIRLTRGALVRMYARGELYQQAITEIKSILEEDPKRIDLEVILAKMLYMSGTIDEAIKVCTSIINRIPFCFEVNQILEKIYIQKNAKENASIYRNRLISLNPYYEFSDSSFSDFEVPENNILLEKATFSPYDTANHTVDKVWSDDTGLILPEEPTENIDWLQEINIVTDKKNNEPITPDASSDSKPESSETDQAGNDDQMPDWMKQAGWQNSFDTGRLSLDHNAHYSFENDRPVFSDQEDDESNTNDNSVKFMDGSISQSNEKGQSNSSLKVTSKDLAMFFSDLSEGSMNNKNKDHENNNDESFPSSEWMSQFSGNGENIAGDDNVTPDLPVWLKNVNDNETTDDDENADMPPWLKGLQSEIEPVSSSTQINNMTNDLPSSNDSMDSNGWEKIIFSDEDKDELPEQPSSDPVDDSLINDDKIPDWVNSVLLSENEQKVQPVIIDTQTGPLNDVKDNNKTDDFSHEDAGVISQQTNDELLDWLRSLKIEDEKSESVVEENTFDSFISQDNEEIAEVPEQKQSQPGDDLNDIAARILASQKLPAQKDYKLTDDIEIPETEPLSPLAQSEEELNDLAAKILASQKLPIQKGYKLEDDIELPEDEYPAPVVQSEEDFNSLAAQILANQKLPIQKDYKLTDDVELPENEHPAVAQSEENLNDLAAKILASQKLPDRKGYKLSDDTELPENETSIEDELSSLFNQPDTMTESRASEKFSEMSEKDTDIDSKTTLEKSSQSISDELSSLLDQRNYSRLISSVIQYIEEGQDQDQLLEMIKPEKDELVNDFSYWQCLGDILAKMNKLSDALSSYKKAEEILIKNITE